MSLKHLLKICLLKIQPFGNFYKSYKDMEKALASCLSIEQQNSQLLSEQAVTLEAYQNKLLELSEYRRKTQEEHFLLFFSEWWSWGATDALLHMYKMLERHTTYWEMEWPALWVVYLCCLLEKKRAIPCT